MTMIDFFEPADPFGGQTQRLVAEAQQGGGDVFEIARTCRNITPGDTASWETEWLELAERTEAAAKKSLSDGNSRTAMNGYFHANQYYRQSDVFLQDPDGKRERFLKARACFRAGAELHDTPIEVIEVSCGDELYDGYFCHPINPAPGKWPVVFLIGGADAFAEGWFSDPAAIPHVAFWGVLLALIGLGAWLLSRRVRHDSVGLLVGILPFAVALYFFFQNVNRLLPPNL